MSAKSTLNHYFPHKVIAATCPGGMVSSPLMTRWSIFSCERFAVYVHLFHRSDVDEWHDHPWSFWTFLASGGYWENQPDGRHWRRRFSLLFRRAEHRHFVEVSRPTWTVVLRLRKRREWGFIVRGAWVLWSRFTATGQRGICNEVESDNNDGRRH